MGITAPVRGRKGRPWRDLPALRAVSADQPGSVPFAPRASRKRQHLSRRLLRAPGPQTLRPLMRLDHARDLSTGFDLDLSIGDRARNVTTGADQKALVDHEVPLDAATHIGIFCRTAAPEDASLGDHHVPAVLQLHLDTSLDDEALAGRNIARKRYVASNDKRPGVD